MQLTAQYTDIVKDIADVIHSPARPALKLEMAKIVVIKTDNAPSESKLKSSHLFVIQKT